MKKRVRLYKAQMGGYNAAQQVQQQQQAPTEQQIIDYITAEIGNGKTQEEVFATLVQSGIDQETATNLVTDVVAYLEEQAELEEAKANPNDEESKQRLMEEEEAEQRRREEEAQAEAYNQQLQEMYNDYPEQDFSDDDEVASDLIMRYGGSKPSKRTFVNNVMKLTKKQLGGQETEDTNTADSTDTGQRQNILKSFIGNVQGTANDALIKQDAERMYNQYFQDGGDTESGMMDFDPYHNLAHYSDTFEHAMPVDQTSVMKVQDGGATLSPRQQRQIMRQNNRMMRQTNRMIQNIPVGYGGYGAGMFPQGINILNIAQPRMMGASFASPFSNYMGGVRMANIDVRRTGMFGKLKEYTINFANDVATNPQLQKELMEQEARNMRQTIKDVTDAGYTTTTTDSGIKGRTATVSTEAASEVDFFKRDDNKNGIPDYLEVTGSSSTTSTGESSSTIPVSGTTSSGVGGGGSRIGSGSGIGADEVGEELVVDETTGAIVPPSMKAAVMQHRANDFYGVVGKYAPNIYTLSDKKGYYYTVADKGEVKKFKGNPSEWTPNTKPIETIKDQSRINYVIDKGKYYDRPGSSSATKSKSKNAFPSYEAWAKNHGYATASAKYKQQYEREKANANKKVYGDESKPYTDSSTKNKPLQSLESNAKFPVTNSQPKPKKQYKDSSGNTVQVYEGNKKGQWGETPYILVKTFDNKGNIILGKSYVKFKDTGPEDTYSYMSYEDWKGKKQEGGIISNPFQDPYGNLQKFIYGGGDDISVPQVAGKLTDDAYFAYGGLTSYQDKGEVTPEEVENNLKEKIKNKRNPIVGETWDSWWTSDGSTPGFKPDNRTWDGKSWVKNDEKKDLKSGDLEGYYINPDTGKEYTEEEWEKRQSSKTANQGKTTTTTTKTTTSNPRTTTQMMGGYDELVAPIYPPLFGGGRGLRGILGANALAANPFIQYAGSWTQQRGLPYDPQTGLPMDISSMANAPLSKIDVRKTRMVSGDPKKYTMYFGQQSDPTAPLITMPGEGGSGKDAAATSRETRDSKGKRKMAPALENALLRVPGMSRLIHPYKDDENAVVAPEEAVSTSFVAPEPVPYDQIISEIGYPQEEWSFRPGEPVDFSSADVPEPQEEMSIEDKLSFSPGETVDFSEIGIEPQESVAQSNATSDIISMPLRPPGEVMSTDRQEALALQDYLQSPGARESLMQFIPEEEQMQMMEANPELAFGESMVGPMNTGMMPELSPEEQEAQYMAQRDLEIAQNPMLNPKMRAMYESLGQDVPAPSEPFYGSPDVIYPGAEYNPDEFTNYDMQGLPAPLISQELLATQDARRAEAERQRQLEIQRQRQLQLQRQRQLALQKQVALDKQKSYSSSSSSAKNPTQTRKQQFENQISYGKLLDMKSETQKNLRKDYGNKYNPSAIIRTFEKNIEKSLGKKTLEMFKNLTPTQQLKYINALPKNQRDEFIMISKGKKGGQLPMAQIGMGNVYTQNPDMVGLSDIDLLNSETAPMVNINNSTSSWVNPVQSTAPVRPNQEKDPTMLEIDPNQFNRQTAVKQKGFAADFKNKNMFNITPEQGLNLFNKFGNMGLQGLENREARQQEKENYKQLIGDNLYGSTNIMSRGTYNVNSGLLDESTMGSVGVVKYGGNIYQYGGDTFEDTDFFIPPSENNWMNGSTLQNLYLSQNAASYQPDMMEEEESYQEGGETWMSEEQINRFLAEGGELEFI